MFFVDKFLTVLKQRYDDDFVDRLNNYFTPLILGLFALTLSAKQYVGQAIQCWVPAQYTGAWEQYSENYCFVQNTYWLPLTEDIPNEYRERDERQIGYYQWVPFVLALQAFLFYLPSMIWRLLNWQSGLSVKGVVNMANDAKNMQEEVRDKNVQTVSMHIQDCLDLQRDLKPAGRLCGMFFYGKHHGSFITGLYLFIKVLYIINVICQFFIMNSFLGPQYSLWGFEILRDLASGREWQESGHFPRVTMCDFEVRELGNLHRHTIQCVLMINMFNEKIFLFLWWWFVIVAIATILNFVQWIVLSVSKPQQRNFVARYLSIKEDLTDSMADQRDLTRFVENTLRPDGVLLLRMIEGNAGDIICADLTLALWKRFKEKKNIPPPPSVTGGNDRAAPAQ